MSYEGNRRIIAKSKSGYKYEAPLCPECFPKIRKNVEGWADTIEIFPCLACCDTNGELCCEQQK